LTGRPCATRTPASPESSHVRADPPPHVGSPLRGLSALRGTKRQWAPTARHRPGSRVVGSARRTRKQPAQNPADQATQVQHQELLELVAADDPQVRPVLFRLEDRRLPLPGQVLEAVGVEKSLVELPSLILAHPRQRRVADDLSDAAAERSVRHWGSLDRRILGGDLRRSGSARLGARALAPFVQLSSAPSRPARRSE
jgi:hypothetical protein